MRVWSHGDVDGEILLDGETAAYIDDTKEPYGERDFAQIVIDALNEKEQRDGIASQFGKKYRREYDERVDAAFAAAQDVFSAKGEDGLFEFNRQKGCWVRRFDLEQREAGHEVYDVVKNGKIVRRVSGTAGTAIPLQPGEELMAT